MEAAASVAQNREGPRANNISPAAGMENVSDANDYSSSAKPFLFRALGHLSDEATALHASELTHKPAAAALRESISLANL